MGLCQSLFMEVEVLCWDTAQESILDVQSTPKLTMVSFWSAMTATGIG